MENGQSVFFLSPHTPYRRVRLARFARIRLIRHALPISLLILRKKPTVLQSMHGAARFDKKYNQRTPGTITSLLEELKWPSLEQRRKQTRLTNLYNFVNGNLAVEIPYYHKIPKISPGAYIFQRPFLRGLFLVGFIFGGAYLRREICILKSIGLA